MIKKTPLYRKHLELSAKMVDFAGWNMPVTYSGVIEEHLAVRNSVGIFDVSHMGEIDIKGEEVIPFLQYILVSDISGMKEGDVSYSLMCLPNGGIVDDLLVYKISDKYFMLCVNASNKDKDLAWITDHSGDYNVGVIDKSEATALISLQGVKSANILTEISDLDISSVRHNNFRFGKVAGAEAMISRTGYTGEDGFEIFFKAEDAEMVWGAMMSAGEKYGIKPIGLAARDTLRLEMKYTLYGNDISDKTNPVEAGLSWAVGFDKEDFIGRDILIEEKKNGPQRKLVGFELLERGIPRAHYAIYADGRMVGEVTSGTHSPSLNKGIGLAYIDTDYAKVGSKIEVEVRRHMVKGEVVKTPFCSGSLKRD
ncbi:MAG: glycine cleavage system aminomethyltransferase GcvT [Nitrospinota bacterium]|nr:glycine cleavage system aminomethyltransferase GcvT [Nitrospinota bacterium]